MTISNGSSSVDAGTLVANPVYSPMAGSAETNPVAGSAFATMQGLLWTHAVAVFGSASEMFSQTSAVELSGQMIWIGSGHGAAEPTTSETPGARTSLTVRL